MISVKFSRNLDRQIFVFTVKNHAKGEVCAAVSALTINAANSLEKFAEDSMRYDYSDGYLQLVLPEGERWAITRDAELLLESLLLGLYSIQEEYSEEIEIMEVNYAHNEFKPVRP